MKLRQRRKNAMFELFVKIFGTVVTLISTIVKIVELISKRSRKQKGDHTPAKG